jgi:predicted O-methyltransferase YrrM
MNKTAPLLRGQPREARSAFYAEYKKRLASWSDIQAHLPFLYEQAAKSKVILELGVRSGISTSALLAGAEQSRGHVWSVDITRPHVPDWWRKSGLWTFTLGNDLYPAVAELQPERVDMLFIDTSHDYEQTLAELRLYVPRLNRGGVVCCHDTELQSGQFTASDYVSFSVAKALETFCAETGGTWENHTGSFGLGIIRK